MGWLVVLAVIVLIFVFLKFTVVKESTAKVVVRFGGFKKVLLAYQGYCIDESQEVVPVSSEPSWIQQKLAKLFGGLRLVGIRWLDDIYTYKFRWRDIELAGRDREPQFHEPTIDYIFLRPDLYWTSLKEAETKPPERVALTPQFVVTLKVVNPYKALFRAPSNWNENVMFQFEALFKDWVATKTLDDLLKLRGEGGRSKLWEELKDDFFIRMIKDDWGIKVEENGILLLELGMSPETQRAIAAEQQQSWEASGRAAQTVGTVVAMMARSRGKSERVINREINSDSELRQEFLGLAKDLVVRQLGIEGKSYLDIRVEGAEGLERTLINALAAWQRMPGGKGGEGQREEGRESPVGTAPRDEETPIGSSVGKRPSKKELRRLRMEHAKHLDEERRKRKQG